MSDITSIGLSGLDAASKRVQAAASNIANSATPDFKPLQVVQQARPDFGVKAEIHQSVTAGDVDLAGQAVDMKAAANNYKANALAIKAADEMQRELLRDFRV